MKKIFLGIVFLFSLPLAAQDLIVTNVSFDSAYYRYSLFGGQVTVKNQGILSTIATSVGIYLTENDSVNENYLGFARIPELEPNEEVLLEINQNVVKIDTGRYTLIANIRSHPDENETNTENNRFTGSEINILETDIDLVITSMTTPTTVSELGALTVNYSVDDLGEKSNISGMYISLYFSEDQVLDANDTQIDVEYASGDFSAGGFSDSETFNLPSSVLAGNYYPILYADTIFNSSYYDEVNETNNAYVGNMIEVTEADIALSVSNVYAYGDYSFLSINFTLRNDGTTDAGNYALNYYLSADDSLDVSDRPISLYLYNEVVPAGGSIEIMYFDDPMYFLPSGDHYLIIAYTDTTTGLPLIAPVASSMFTIDEYSLQFDIDSIWTTYQLYSGTDIVPLNFQISNNTGNYIHGFWVEYEFTLHNSEGQIVYSETDIDYLFLADSSISVETYEFQLGSALEAGQYLATVSYQEAWSGSSGVSGNLTAIIEIKDAVFTIKTNFIGNENEVISKGKVYLYRDIGQDSTWVQDTIINVVDGVGSSIFIEGEDDYTVYVIPDPVLYPNYVPTILGNTFKLTETSFTHIGADTVFNIIPIYVPALDSMGTQTITGQVSGSTSQGGRFGEAAIPAENILIYLLNNLGEVIAVTTTDSNGYYSFANLESGDYAIYINDGEILLLNDVEVEVQLVDGVDEIVVSTDLSEPNNTEITLYDFNFSIDSLSFQQPVKPLDNTVRVRLNIRGNSISSIENLQTHFIFSFSSPSNLNETFVYDTLVSLSLNEFTLIDVELTKPLWVNGEEASYVLSASYKTKYSNEEQSLLSKVFAVDVVSKVNNKLNDGFSYFPNPFKKSIQIISPLDVNEVLLLTLKGENIPIETSQNDKGFLVITPPNNLPQGNYILQLKINNKIKSFKVLKSE